MEKKDKIAMLEQSLDRKLTTLEMYENRPRKWILYLVIVLAVALLVGWSADDIHFTGLTATGTEVAKGVVHGVFHPDTGFTALQSPWAVTVQRANLTLVFPGKEKVTVRSVPLAALDFLEI